MTADVSTTDQLRKDLEIEKAALLQKQEAFTNREIQLEDALRQARQNTAFVTGQISQLTQTLGKLTKGKAK